MIVPRIVNIFVGVLCVIVVNDRCFICHAEGWTYLTPEYSEVLGIVFSGFWGGVGGGFLEDADIVEDGRDGVDILDGIQISDLWHFDVIGLFDG